MRIRRWAVAVVGASALGCPALAAGHLPLLTHHGRWLTDPQGRVVVLHGVQVDKVYASQIEHIDLNPASVSLIGAVGFNLARVSLSYAGVEPTIGHFDPAYVDQYLGFDRRLSAAGVYDLLDMMQGMYAAEFDGGGFPPWMVITNGAPNVPGPFPQSYLYDPAEERAWDNFWANAPAADGMGLQDHYARGLRYLATQFATTPGLLGFDLLNEPWPGSQYPTCANPEGCPVFDRTMLNAFYRRIIPALRSVEERHPVFYEPHALFDQGAATSVGNVGDRNAVFTFHNYCLGDQPGLPQSDPGQDCGIEEQMVLANAEAQSQRTGDGLLEDEWGNTASLPLLARMTAEADQDMVGWSYWAWEDCCNSPGAIVVDGTKPPNAPNNLRTAVLSALVRPYPQLIAGTPSGWSFDPASDTFRLSYSTLGVGGTRVTAATRVELPALRYPTGYSVSTRGARVLSAPDADPLVLVAQPNAQRITVSVTPAHHHPKAASDPVPQDCSMAPAHTLRLHSRAITWLYIDGLRVARSHGDLIRVPAGLANGTRVALKRGATLLGWGLVQGCSLELRTGRR